MHPGIKVVALGSAAATTEALQDKCLIFSPQ